MTVKTSMSLTDRHHRYVARKVEEGAFASASAVVAAAIERLIEDEAAQETALQAMAEEIRRRQATPLEDFIDLDTDDLFERTRRSLQAAPSPRLWSPPPSRTRPATPKG